eukprot:scaffold81158_cov36-Attheya_sp.AAC.2
MEEGIGHEGLGLDIRGGDHGVAFGRPGAVSNAGAKAGRMMGYGYRGRLVDVFLLGCPIGGGMWVLG